MNAFFNLFGILFDMFRVNHLLYSVILKENVAGLSTAVKVSVAAAILSLI